MNGLELELEKESNNQQINEIIDEIINTIKEKRIQQIGQLIYHN